MNTLEKKAFLKVCRIKYITLRVLWCYGHQICHSQSTMVLWLSISVMCYVCYPSAKPAENCELCCTCPEMKMCLGLTYEQVLYGLYNGTHGHSPLLQTLLIFPFLFLIFSEVPMDECSYSSGPGRILVSSPGNRIVNTSLVNGTCIHGVGSVTAWLDPVGGLY